MLAFVIAIHREAEGLITHFGLSKDMHPILLQSTAVSP